MSRAIACASSSVHAFTWMRAVTATLSRSHPTMSTPPFIPGSTVSAPPRTGPLSPVSRISQCLTRESRHESWWQSSSHSSSVSCARTAARGNVSAATARNVANRTMADSRQGREEAKLHCSTLPTVEGLPGFGHPIGYRPMTSFRSLAVLIALASTLPLPLPAQASRLDAEIDRRATHVEGKVVAWRRDIHAHPELSNREVRTAQVVAEHLRPLGLEVRTGVAHNGVVAVLRGGRPGPVVALRADMDALPVTEDVDVPFASKVRTTYNGQDVGVMHACGHDAHVAILMGTAEVLAGMRPEIPGTVKFIFKPAPEGGSAR